MLIPPLATVWAPKYQVTERYHSAFQGDRRHRTRLPYPALCLPHLWHLPTNSSPGRVPAFQLLNRRLMWHETRMKR